MGHANQRNGTSGKTVITAGGRGAASDLHRRDWRSCPGGTTRDRFSGAQSFSKPRTVWGFAICGAPVVFISLNALTPLQDQSPSRRSGHADAVAAWFERWRQTEWPSMKVAFELRSVAMSRYTTKYFLELEMAREQLAVSELGGQVESRQAAIAR